ncbi:MAG: hypothetical protein KGL43_04605 [Burkholderiales bacterium]|nr:hypothetical protein [Burkholderiales bacterium]
MPAWTRPVRRDRRASSSQLLLHVDMDVRRVAPFPSAVLARVQALAQA